MNWQKMAIDNACNILQWNIDQNEGELLWRVYYLLCQPLSLQDSGDVSVLKNEANSLTYHRDI